MIKSFYLTAFALTLLSMNTALAGHSEGNGGDVCENRIKLIREDLSSWILRGGGDTLRLPPTTSAATYADLILANVKEASVSCVDQELVVGGNSKTCVNFVDTSGKKIVCNLSRFQTTSESDQYVLIHHEYAGLSGLEITTQGESDYSISNQISGSLEDQVVKKLVVRSQAPSVCRTESLVGTYAGTMETQEIPKWIRVKITIFPPMNPTPESTGCPRLRVIYSRPDLMPGVGTILSHGIYDPVAARLTIRNDSSATTGQPGNQDLHIRTLQLSESGFTGEMSWWKYYGPINVTKCSGDSVSRYGNCNLF